MVQKPDKQHETARDHSEIQQLEDRTLYALAVHDGDTQDHQSDMADAGKSQHLAEIGLSQRHQRPIERAEPTQHRHQPEAFARRRRGQRQGKAQDAERAELEAHQQRAQAHRPLPQHGRQPGMKRKQRSLNGKTEKQQQKDGGLHRRRQRLFEQRQVIER